jgi:hypothetical protein
VLRLQNPGIYNDYPVALLPGLISMLLWTHQVPIALHFARPFNNRIEVRDAKLMKMTLLTLLTLHFFEPVPLSRQFSFATKRKTRSQKRTTFPYPASLSKLLDSMILD